MSAISSYAKFLLPENIRITDLIQVLIIYFILYYCFKNIYKTRAWILVKALLVIGLAYLCFFIFDLTALQYIIQSVYNIFLIAIVIMFQPELQKMFEKIGTKKFSDIIKGIGHNKPEQNRYYSLNVIDEVIQACDAMSEVKTGALIVFERGVPLTDICETGIKVGATVSKELLINTFEKNTPLHDGAVVIRKNQLDSATCYLPLSQSTSISKRLGTRHRAGIGVTENTDAIAVIVSEETGAISLCRDGKIEHKLSKAKLSEILNKESINEGLVKVNNEKHTSWTFKAIIGAATVALWLFIMMVSDPVGYKNFYNIPVQLLNTEKLNDVNKAYELNQGKTVDIKVKARTSVLNSISEDSINAIADVNNLSIVYSIPIDINIDTPSEYETEIISDKNVIIELEDIVSAELPVSVDTFGEVPSGYYLADKKSDVGTITVKGPKSLVSKMEYAMAEVNISNVIRNEVKHSQIKIYDGNNDLIEEDKYTASADETDVALTVYKTKNIPLEISLAENDNYDFLDVDYDSKIAVAANEDMLRNLNELKVEIDEVQVDENTKAVLINLELYLPENVYLANGQAKIIEIPVEVIKKGEPSNE